MHDLALLFGQSLLISLVTFGGGSQALFEDFAVHATGWLSYVDFSAALAFGFSTPGPAVFSIATFIGYQRFGLAGALVGSVGVYLAPWLLALYATQFGQHLLHSRTAGAFSRGVGLAVVGLLLLTAWGIGAQSQFGWGVPVLVALAAYASWRKVNPLIIVGAGLVLGVLL